MEVNLLLILCWSAGFLPREACNILIGCSASSARGGAGALA